MAVTETATVTVIAAATETVTAIVAVTETATVTVIAAVTETATVTGTATVTAIETVIAAVTETVTATETVTGIAELCRPLGPEAIIPMVIPADVKKSKKISEGTLFKGRCPFCNSF